jgi:PAS domain S-box-containing protein
MRKSTDLGATCGRTLLGMLDDGIVFHDAEGVIVDCNPAAERILGIRLDDLLGHASLFPRVQALDEHGAGLPPDAEPVWEALRTLRPSEVRSVRFLPAGSPETWLELSCAPVQRAPGEAVRGAITRIVDVGDRRALEDRARGRQRLELMGRLAGGVAHDFNNLLTVILGYNSLLLDSLDVDDPRRHESDEVRKAAQRGAELTRQLLSIGRGQVLETRLLDLNLVLADAAPMLRHVAGQRVEVVVTGESAPLRVRADQGQVDQVLLNLVLNARDAMPDGGTVRLTLGAVDLDAAFEAAHPGSRRGRHALIQVIDRGCGMEAATLSRIFEPFFSTKPHDKGTGLGLATVYGIVKQHGGYVDVESTPGHGTTFRVYLPVSGEVAERASDAWPRVTRAAARSSVLLVVEDESLRGLARRVLERGGFEVLGESDGPQALAAAEAHAGPLAALVTDFVLPGLSGLALARSVIALRPETSVLFLSGYADVTAEPPTLPMREVHMLAKPFRPDALLEKLREVIARHDSGRGVEAPR